MHVGRQRMARPPWRLKRSLIFRSIIYTLRERRPYALYFVDRSAKRRISEMKSFVIGVLVGVLLLTGAVYYYFVSGMAPAAAADRPMPFEKKLASKSLSKHIEKANVPTPPIPANEENFLAGAKVYKDQCAGCHGLPGQPPPTIADKMYPHATLLFKG